MMVIKDGIGYSTQTQAAFYSDPGKISVPKDPTIFISTDWSPWGDFNDEPTYIADDIQNCGVLSAGIESEARLAVGKSIDPYLMVDKAQDGTEVLESVLDTEILDFLEANDSYLHAYSNVRNMLGYGLGATQFLLNANRDKINRIKATDIYNARLGKRDPKSGLMSYLYLCSNWLSAPAVWDNDRIKRVPLLEEGWELQQLQQTGSGYEFAMLHRILKDGRLYYPQPLHRSAKAWVAITRSVPNIKAAINKNQMMIKYLVLIADKFWSRIHKKWDSYTPQERERVMQEKYKSINDWLTGELNAGKAIIAGNYYDPIAKAYVEDVQITVLDDKMKDGKMLPDSAAADKQILFSMFANPAIFGGNLLGDGASGGAGSGSDIREATLVLMMLLHPERTNNLRIYNLIKNFNGWSKRLEVERTVFAVTDTQSKNQTSRKIIPRLVFRYSSSILTTLDTGKSQKPIIN